MEPCLSCDSKGSRLVMKVVMNYVSREQVLEAVRNRKLSFHAAVKILQQLKIVSERKIRVNV
jgi:hypothetical protein